MKFEIGDKIILLHSREEGTVVDYINEEMVMVEVEGIVFPVYADQIEYPYFERFSGKRGPGKISPGTAGDLPPEKKPAAPQPETGVWLSFLPVYSGAGEETVHELKIYLVNETWLAYRFRYRLYTGNSLFLDISNEAPPFSDFYLNDLLFERLNDNPLFEFLFTLKEPDQQLAGEFKKLFRPKAKQVFRKLEEARLRQDASFRFPLFEKYPAAVIPEKMDFDIARQGASGTVRRRKQHSASGSPDIYSPKYEVDLHIEKIIPDWSGLSNFEILTIQLHEFQRYMEAAIAARQFSMVVIHGVGKGKLREEIHDILRRTPEVRNFVNQYDIRYGYGATEIFFKS